MPDEAEVHCLLALMLLHDARREARFADGTVVLLADQDRALWDQDEIAEGRSVLDRGIALGGRGPYSLQAAIASLHLEQPLDWPQIAALYGELGRQTGSAVVELNRAVAIAEAGEVGRGLALLEKVELASYYLAHAARADLLLRLGREEESRAAYARALELVRSEAERSFIESRLDELAVGRS
jgi:RNA polymerase sigma-70 factor (ECF subfamily)